MAPRLAHRSRRRIAALSLAVAVSGTSVFGTTVTLGVGPVAAETQATATVGVPADSETPTTDPPVTTTDPPVTTTDPPVTTTETPSVTTTTQTPTTTAPRSTPRQTAEPTAEPTYTAPTTTRRPATSSAPETITQNVIPAAQKKNTSSTVTALIVVSIVGILGAAAILGYLFLGRLRGRR